MSYVIAVLIALFVGFVLGLFFGPNLGRELLSFRLWFTVELSKLHQKLDAIFAAVKK